MGCSLLVGALLLGYTISSVHPFWSLSPDYILHPFPRVLVVNLKERKKERKKVRKKGRKKERKKESRENLWNKFSECETMKNMESSSPVFSCSNFFLNLCHYFSDVIPKFCPPWCWYISLVLNVDISRHCQITVLSANCRYRRRQMTVLTGRCHYCRRRQKYDISREEEVWLSFQICFNSCVTVFPVVTTWSYKLKWNSKHREKA